MIMLITQMKIKWEQGKCRWWWEPQWWM